MSQKYHHGDLVRVADNLGSSMSHFQSGCDAIVVGSYLDQYGGNGSDNDKVYTLYFRGRGTSSWYYEHQLALVEANRGDLLRSWKEEVEERNAKESDLDWIFDPANRETMLTTPPNASIRGLAACLLITEDGLWGPHGEGISYYTNAYRLLAHAQPYLERSSKADWLAYCEELMKKVAK